MSEHPIGVERSSFFTGAGIRRPVGYPRFASERALGPVSAGDVPTPEAWATSTGSGAGHSTMSEGPERRPRTECGPLAVRRSGAALPGDRVTQNVDDLHKKRADRARSSSPRELRKAETADPLLGFGDWRGPDPARRTPAPWGVNCGLTSLVRRGDHAFAEDGQHRPRRTGCWWLYVRWPCTGGRVGGRWRATTPRKSWSTSKYPRAGTAFGVWRDRRMRWCPDWSGSGWAREDQRTAKRNDNPMKNPH